MRFEGYDDELPDEDALIEGVLGENSRSRDLRLMRAALEQRRSLNLRERGRTTDERERSSLQAKLQELDKQIAAVRQEESISGFVEASVRITMHKPEHEERE